MDKALDGLMLCKFRNSGQTCVTANRIYVQSGIYEEFSRRLCERIKSSLVQGNGLEENVNIGPLINKAAIAKVSDHVQDALNHGGKVILGGTAVSGSEKDYKLRGEDAKSGFFFRPTVVINANHKMKVATEETFGPVAFLFKVITAYRGATHTQGLPTSPLVPPFYVPCSFSHMHSLSSLYLFMCVFSLQFETEEEVLSSANSVDAGLASYFFTRDAGRQWRMSEKLQYGMVGANTGTVSSTTAPFGGVKQSGFGREGAHHGLTDYLDIKAVHMAI